jgi:hypothetical protein
VLVSTEKKNSFSFGFIIMKNISSLKYLPIIQTKNQGASAIAPRDSSSFCLELLGNCFQKKKKLSLFQHLILKLKA